LSGCLAVTCLAATGCGETTLVPAAGVVVLDGQPLPQAKVTFSPAEGTAGAGGMGITDATGHFELFNPQGEPGLPPGSYRVTVNKTELKRGFEEGVAVTDADVRELLPPRYSSPEKTELRQTVGSAAGELIRLQLVGGRKK